jgi:hypothetical protein
LSVTLFAQNLLESAASITVQPPSSQSQPLARLYDRNRGPQWANAGANRWNLQLAFPLGFTYLLATQTIIDLDLGVDPDPVSAMSWANHGITGAVLVYGDNATIPTTLRLTANLVSGVNFYGAITLVTRRYWRFVIPTLTPVAGELFLGVPHVITRNPFLDTARIRTQGNVGRDRSRGGYLWSAKRGPSRGQFPWGWNGLTEAELVEIETAFAECDEGAKKIIVVDEFDTVRWMDWLDDKLDPTPVKGGPADADRLYALDLFLEEAL